MKRFAVGLACGLLLIGNAQSQTPAPVDDQDQIAESLPDYLFYPLQQTVAPEASSQQIAVANLWPTDQVLRVCFFGGNPVVKRLVASVAVDWNRSSSVKFDFGVPGVWRDCADRASGFSQIRLGFAMTGYWSLVGRQGDDVVLGTQATMNLQGFDRRYHPQSASDKGLYFTEENVVALSRPRDRGTILHEFGHALGLKHEHQNEALRCRDAIRWDDRPTAYDYFGGPPNYWSRAKVDANLGRHPLPPEQHIQGKPDPDSIEMYNFPLAIKKDGAPSLCFNRENNVISVMDRAFVSRLYSSQGLAASIDANNFAAPAAASFAASSPSGREDTLERVKVDLVSEITSVRREARRQLAGLMQASQSPTLAAELTQEAVGKSYRRQLGVVEAIGGAKVDYGSDPAARSAILKSLDAMRAANRDKTLDQALNAARARVN